MAKQTILVVDNNQGTREVLVEHLRAKNYEVIEARDGKEGLELFHANPQVQLVMTDWDMPLMDGPDMIRKMREDRPVPFLLMTARSIEDVKKHFPEFMGWMKQTTASFLAKPLNLNTVKYGLERLLPREQDIMMPGERPKDQGDVNLKIIVPGQGPSTGLKFES